MGGIRSVTLCRSCTLCSLVFHEGRKWKCRSWQVVPLSLLHLSNVERPWTSPPHFQILLTLLKLPRPLLGFPSELALEGLTEKAAVFWSQTCESTVLEVEDPGSKGKVAATISSFCRGGCYKYVPRCMHRALLASKTMPCFSCTRTLCPWIAEDKLIIVCFTRCRVASGPCRRWGSRNVISTQ